MRVLHFSTVAIGGAGLAARLLHESLLDSGVESEFYSGFPAGSPQRGYRRPVRPLNLHTKVTSWVYACRREYYVRGRNQGWEPFRLASLGTNSNYELSTDTSTVLHMHWIADFLDYPTFFRTLPPGIPVVWTLHDMNPFTGGCHYSWDCPGFEFGCGNCPQLNSHRGKRDLSYQEFQVKAKALAGLRLHVVANSQWTKMMAQKSPVFADAATFDKIFCGVDVNCFTPRPRAACRQALGLPAQVPILCMGADNLDNRRKGFDLALRAVSELADLKPLVLCFGGAHEQTWSVPVEIRHLGYIHSPELLSLVYSAADVFIMPSRHEALGLTALEAMACGVPAVGFRVGGVPESIRPGQTGRLAEPDNAVDLSRQVRALLIDEEERAKLGSGARAMVCTEFSSECQLQSYLKLYQSVLP